MKVRYIILSLTVIIAVVGVGLAYYVINDSLVRFQWQDILSQDFFSSFSQPVVQPKQPKAPEEVSAIFTGDIMLSRVVAQKIKEHGLAYPFLQVGDYLKSADFVFGNLETPLTPGREIESGEMVFRAEPDLAQVLSDYNFQVLSLANNHTPNFGEQGLLDTFNYLEQAGIKYAGAGRNNTQAYAPAYFEKQGVKFAFLAYTYPGIVPQNYEAAGSRAGTAFMNTAMMVAAVKEAKNQDYLVVVSMHAGDEYTATPNRQQVDFAHTAVKAGADLVIGHHPHWVQSAEIYQGKYIFYSLGNFVFDQMWSQATREGLALKITFDSAGVKKIEPRAVLISDYAQPSLLEGAAEAEIVQRLRL